MPGRNPFQRTGPRIFPPILVFLPVSALLGIAILTACKGRTPGAAADSWPSALVLEKGRSACLSLEAKMESEGALFTKLAGDPASARVRSPWTDARALRGFALCGDYLCGAVNAYGAALFRDLGDRGLSISGAVHPDFKGRTVTAVFARSGRFYVFLSSNDTFRTAAGGARLLSMAPAEGAFRREPLSFESEYPPAEWNPIALEPLGEGTCILHLVRQPDAGDAEEAYLELGEDGDYRNVDRRSLEDVWNPPPSSELPAALQALIQPGLALARYGLAPAEASVFIVLRVETDFAARPFLAHGRVDAAASAELYVFAAAGKAVALYPGGELGLGLGLQAGAMRLPALPATFDYGECAIVGNWVIGAWTENVYPEIGAAGISVLRLP